MTILLAIRDEDGRRLSLAALGQRLLVYVREPNDRAAAAALGISSPAWTTWRNRIGLPPKGRNLAEDGRRLRLWAKSCCDVTFSQAASLSYQDGRNWRRKAGLPRKGGCDCSRLVRDAAGRILGRGDAAVLPSGLDPRVLGDGGGLEHDEDAARGDVPAVGV